MSRSERAVQLLALANYRKVGTALKVSRASVARWAKGEITPWQLQRLEDLMGSETRNEAAPPDWAERLLATVEAMRLRDGITEDELAAAEADLFALRNLGTNARRRKRGSGGASGGSGTAV
jgi:hypothetical protein